MPTRAATWKEWVRRATRWRGYDCFVSYGSRDAVGYARDLAERLNWQSFRAFLDSEEMTPQTPFEVVLRRGLKRSRTLVVIMSEAAHASDWVAWEVQTFERLEPRRLVILVTPWTAAPNAGSSRLTTLTKSMYKLDEDSEALAAGVPSQDTINSIAIHLSNIRDHHANARIPTIGMLLVIVLAIIAGLVGIIGVAAVVFVVATAMLLCYSENRRRGL